MTGDERIARLDVEVKHIKETIDKVDEKTDKISDKLDSLIISLPSRPEIAAEFKVRDEAIAALADELQVFKRQTQDSQRDNKHLLPTWVSVVGSIVALGYTFLKG